MILESDIFVLGDNLLHSATAIKLFFSLDTLQKTSGFGRCILKIKDTSFINDVKGDTSCVALINAIYYASVVLKSILVCNLIYHNTVHPTYVITDPVRDMTFSELSASD